MPRHRCRTGLTAVLVVGLLAGCGDDWTLSALKPNDRLRKVLEAPVAAPAPEHSEHRPGYDARGRLKTAAGLVHGFEVPMGLTLARSHPSFIVLQSRAHLDEIQTFYSGKDLRTGRVFAEKGYKVTRHRGGLEIQHTPEALRRLGLGPQYAAARLTAASGRVPGTELRVHTVTRVEATVLPPERPRADPEIPPADRALPPLRGADAPRRTVTAGGVSGAAPGDRAHARAARAKWGARSEETGRVVRKQVEAWKRAHPGQTFLD